MQATEKEQNRQILSNHVLNRILSMAKTISKDTLSMGKDLVKKDVNILLSQLDSLRNFFFVVNAEISNNHCEQRMKPIKLDLKNCQNIGSEGMQRMQPSYTLWSRAAGKKGKIPSPVCAISSKSSNHLPMMAKNGSSFPTGGCRYVKINPILNFSMASKH